ncbi:hypothetical protein [Streptomyces sp. NBC_01794]|uniref:hypothetical protein n=1 Tax=Streptomyces sp. NBC_01794 TaxID=2975942 RepID=UPI003091DF2D|nr:hypothetical protein OIE54_28865 [Streptomyces sp. NBC_01794]
MPGDHPHGAAVEEGDPGERPGFAEWLVGSGRVVGAAAVLRKRNGFRDEESWDDWFRYDWFRDDGCWDDWFRDDGCWDDWFRDDGCWDDWFRDDGCWDDWFWGDGCWGDWFCHGDLASEESA